MTALTTFPLLNDLNHLCRALSVAPLFSPELQRALSILRVPGDWPRQPGRIRQSADAFFRSEAAALGPMRTSSVAAHFFVFPRELVERALADRTVDDGTVFDARLEAGSQLMGRVLGSPNSDADATLAFLRQLVDGLDTAARPGFAALAEIEWPRAVWAQTCLAAQQIHKFHQESRFHAAASQLNGAEFLALTAASQGLQPDTALSEAGWHDDAIDNTLDQLISRGLLIDERVARDGRALLREIEFVADRAQRELSVRIDDRAHEHLNRLEEWGNRIVNDRQMRDAVQSPSYALLSCL